MVVGWVTVIPTTYSCAHRCTDHPSDDVLHSSNDRLIFFHRKSADYNDDDTDNHIDVDGNNDDDNNNYTYNDEDINNDDDDINDDSAAKFLSTKKSFMAWSKKIVLNFSAFDAAQFRLTMKENDQTSNDILWSANVQCYGSALKHC